MTLDEAKASAKVGIIASINEYINEQLPAATLIHAMLWEVNVLADGAVASPGTGALLQSIFNFVVLLQQAAQPFFPLIDAATTVDEVWAAQAGFNPRVVPPPAAAGSRFYATRLERVLGDPT